MSGPSETLVRILADAVDIPSADARRAYVERACGGDAALRARVEELVANHFRAGAFLEQPAAGLGTTAPAGAADSHPRQVGPYRLREPLGEGGMGVVYVAEQQHPVRRLVALKLIRPGMDSAQVVARFEAERQALALMDHPNIAKVLDAGTTADGRPFFVMDLIRGLPITQYCDQARLTVRQRLGLFAQVCRAVQHAHQKGVIHRDLKPGNVLVTSHDGVPVPVVIDFGVAKALGGRLTDRTVYTGFHALVGTPLYMSPEQAEFNQFGVDTRSDVYALGVVLYELLTGTTPIDRERLKTAGYDEFRRILREEEPPRPSARLSTVAAAQSTASARRCADTGTLTRSLHGELDWIVLKALEKDRERRYQTAADFAADVDRHLADEPVQACPPSAWYRSRKFLRRHRVRLGVGAVTLAAVVVAAGSVAAVVLDQRHRTSVLRGQVDAALSEATEHLARRRLPEANAAVRRAEELIAGRPAAPSSDAVRQWRHDLDMAARLDDIRLEAAETKNDQVDHTAVDRAYADAFREYGIEVDADPEAVGAAVRGRPIARELAVALDGWAGHRKAARDPADAGWRHLLAVARAADPDPWRVRLREALEADDRAALLRLVKEGGVFDQPPETQCALGVALDRLGEPGAVGVLRRGQREHPTDFWLNLHLATVRYRQDPPAWPDVLRFYTAAAVLRPQSALAQARLAMALAGNGNHAAAQAAAEEARRLDPNSAFAHYALAQVFKADRRYDDAIAAYREAIRLRPSDVIARNSLGTTLAQTGRLDEACRVFREALQIQPKYTLLHFNLALALKEAGDLDGAAQNLNELIRLDPAAGDNVHNNFGNVLFDQKKYDEAEKEYRRAVELNPRSAFAHNNLGNALAVLSRPQEAVVEYRQAIRLNPSYFVPRCNLCELRTKTGDDPAADLKAFEQAVRDERNEEAAVDGGFYLAQAYHLAGKIDAARVWFEQTSARLEKLASRSPKLTALRDKTAQAVKSNSQTGSDRSPR